MTLLRIFILNFHWISVELHRAGVPGNPLLLHHAEHTGDNHPDPGSKGVGRTAWVAHNKASSGWG